MQRATPLAAAVLAALAAASAGGAAPASALPALSAAAPPRNVPAAVFDTGTPPDAFGIDGFDVSSAQSVAFRFFCNADGPLHAVELWLMSNANGSAPLPTVDVSLRTGSAAAPGPAAQALERWAGVPVAAAGWSPLKVTLNSSLTPALAVGDYLWVVAASSAPPGADPLWAMSDSAAFGATNAGGDSPWQPGAAGQAAAVRVLIYQAPMVEGRARR